MAGDTASAVARARPHLVPLVEAALTGGAYALLQRYDLVGNIPFVDFVVLLVVTSAFVQFWSLTRVRWGSRPFWLHGAVVTNIAAATVVMYATAWGPALVFVGFLVVLSELAKPEGSRAYRVGLPWALAAALTGQLAVEWGWVPTEIKLPVAHGLAGLSTLGMAFVVQQLYVVTKSREDARAEIERRESHFRALVQNASDMVIVTNADGVVTYASPSVASTGFSPEGYEGERPTDLVHHDDLVRLAETRQRVMATPGALGRCEIRALHADRTYHWYEVTSNNLLTDPAVQGVVSNIRDVTDRKLAEDERARYTAELQRTNTELTEAHHAKDEFVATVSHELRTPLTAILGFAHGLSERWDEFSDREKREFATAVHRQSKRLHRMVEDLLVLSRIARGDVIVEPENVVLTDVVTESLETFGPPEGAVIRVPRGLAARVDPDHLHRIIGNLLTNAEKYGAPPIEVIALEAGDEVELRVRDHGPGVDPGFVDHLFDKFTQHSSGDTRRSQGLGLGLPIVQELVAANGGRIWYEPARPGACFVVRLHAPAPRAVSDDDSGSIRGIDERLTM